jgi:NAD(P)-dependent dehydrogenase (short-subunit alcohol dehydrogenase family)
VPLNRMKSQKVVVITGASQGIGAHVVEAFRKLDYRIVATSRSIKPSNDENVLNIAAGDIRDPTTAQRVISEGVARFGRIDTLLNNAGIYTEGLSPSTPPRTTPP